MRRSLVLLFILAVAASGDAQVDPLAVAWNRFVKEANQFADGVRAGTFDAREAKRLSKLWREIEHSGCWPEVKEK